MTTATAPPCRSRQRAAAAAARSAGGVRRQPTTRALAARLHAHGVVFATLPSPDGRVAPADDAVLFVTDGRSASQRAAD